MSKKDGEKKEGEGEESQGDEVDIKLGGFFGGLLDGIEKFVDLAQKAQAAGGTLRREHEFKGRTAGGKPMQGVYGFTIKTGLGKERSRVETFGNIKKTKQGPRVVVETREPLVDIFDEPDTIVVIVELPGAQKEEIKLEVKDDILSLETSGERKYAKEILLPAKIDPDSQEVSYKNAVLEVKFKKKKN